MLDLSIYGLFVSEAAKPRLLQQVAGVLRAKHYSLRTEQDLMARLLYGTGVRHMELLRLR